jgi:hypothetical protein
MNLKRSTSRGVRIFPTKKMVLLKVVQLLKTYQHTFHGLMLTGAKFCIHLRSLNIRYFEMVEGTGLKLQRRGHLQRHDLSA